MITCSDQQFPEENTELNCEFSYEVNVDGVGFLLFDLNSHCQLSRSPRGRNENQVHPTGSISPLIVKRELRDQV